MGCFFSGLTSGSSAIGQLGKSIGVCGRQAISNPVVDAIGGAALAYFAPELLGAGGLGGLTGMGVAANAGLVTGGIVGLSTGNLTKGLNAGLAGWAGAGLEGMATAPSSQAVNQQAINEIGARQYQPGPYAEYINNSPNMAENAKYYAENPVATNPSTAGVGASNPTSASTLTPAPAANASAVANATNNQSMWDKAKCFVSTSYAANPGYTVAAGLGAVALGAQALKKAAQPNTIAAATSPPSNVIRQYSYNPYTESMIPVSTTNASNFGGSNFTPNANTYHASYPTANGAEGGIVALANGGIAFANGGSYNRSVNCGFSDSVNCGRSDLMSNLQAQLNDAKQLQCRAEEAGEWGQQEGYAGRVSALQQQIENLSNPKSVLEDTRSYNGCYNACRNVAAPTPPPPEPVAPPPAPEPPSPPAPEPPPPAPPPAAAPPAAAEEPVQQVAPPAPGITALQEVNNTPVQPPPAFVPPTPAPPAPELPPPTPPVQSPFTGGITTLPANTTSNSNTPTEIQVPIGPTAPAPIVTPAPVLPPSQMPQAPDQGVGGSTGAGVVGGGTVINPNGSVTESPKIPGIPVGGFTGISSLLNAYQSAGGNLGNPISVPTTMDQFNKEYNTLSGDSQAAYDFLMGKTKQPTVTTASILQKPYAVSVGACKLGPSGASYSYQNPGVNQATVPSDAKQVQGSVYVSNGTNYLSDGTIITPYQNGQYTDQYGYIYDASGRPIGSVPGHANGGLLGYAQGSMPVGHLGGYSDGGRLLRGPGDGVSDSIPATIGAHNPEPARLADGEFVVPARIVSELGNGSTEAGARKLYQMMDRIQKNRSHSVGHNKVAVNSHSDKFLPA